MTGDAETVQSSSATAGTTTALTGTIRKLKRTSGARRTGEVMGRKAATVKNVSKVLRAWADCIDNDDCANGSTFGRKVIASRLNALLDDLVDEDFFGTEAQCDPRGDQR